MKIAIIAAMSKELDLILKGMGNYSEICLDGMKLYEGRIGSHDVVATQCGIGKVNAAIRTYNLIRNVKPELVINSGVAGGTDSSMKIGQILVATDVAYHDVWCGPGTEYGAADGMPVKFKTYDRGVDLMRRMASDEPSSFRFGLLCSGDKFISTPEQVKTIKSDFPEALGCDMESAAIAQVCMMTNTNFMIVRVMSDMPGGGENISEYQNFWNDAPVSTFKAVYSLIENL